MPPVNEFAVLNIREYLENEDGMLGEDKLMQFLSEFSCPLNTDVERFLKQQSIEFTKKQFQMTVSYRIYGKEKFIVGGEGYGVE